MTQSDCNLKYWAKGSYGISNGFPRNKDKGGGNCTWYAFGRAWELLGSLPKLCTNNAGAWWNYNKNNNFYSYGSTPKLGAIAVWDKYDNNNGHVAVVEEIGNNYIICSESGWNYKTTYFQTVKRSLNNSSLDMGSNYRFLGYIYILNGTIENNPHIHNWKYAWDWSAHPHYSEYKCTTCGQIKTEKTPNYRKDCIACNPAPTPPPTPPSSPSIRVSSTNFAVGKAVTVSWNTVDRATGYDVQLIHSKDSGFNQNVSVGGTSTTLNINHPGSYTVTVRSKNQYGSSGASNQIKINAHNPLSVTFADHDGTVLNRQTVRYGEEAAAPDSPTREGYTFTGWDRSFSKITTDITVKAQYKINTYSVKFISRTGETIETQRIEYGSGATPPEPPEAPPGYIFAGWDKEDYKFVKKDLSIHAVFVWEKENLPIKFTAAPIVRRNEMGSGYTADLTLYNYPDITTDGKIVIVLKTTEGKMVASKTEAISLSAGQSSKRSLFVPYDGVASTAEVTVVAIIDNDKTGVPISEKAVIDVDLNLEWSDWSIVKPNQSEQLSIEERTEYRNRTKSTTTSSNSSMSGWTKYDTTSYWGNWSGWLNYNPGSSSARQTQSRYIQPTYRTKYHYERIRLSNGKYHFCTPTAQNYYGSSIKCIKYEELRTDSPLYNTGSVWYHVDWCDCPTRVPHTLTCGRTTYTYNSYNDPWYNERTYQEVASNGYTQWQYRDLHYTYHFYKWNDWGGWSPDAVTSNNNREVETRTAYRYKSTFSADMEDNEGVRRSLSGAVDNAADGKQVTLYVFKGANTDPTESQLEYVGQTTLSNGGQYSFDFITKEEPSEKTGDFIIMIGVEGALSPFYVDTIKAPVPAYEVSFAVDGTVIDTQTILKGEAAVLPDPPEKEGYQFIGWDMGVTNIQDNAVINAVYTPNHYSVVFLDWDHRTIDTKTFQHGEMLQTPEPSEKEGSTFAGWDKIIDGKTEVTENMIITAQYDLNEYEVVFYDSDGSIISKQKIKYGQEAEKPGDPILEGYVFDTWSHSLSLSSITQDLNVYPVFKYEQTADEPVFSVYESEKENQQIVMLASDNPDAIIYYTIDGSDPSVDGSELGIENVNGTVYSEALEMPIETIIKAIAYENGKNTSTIAIYYVNQSEIGVDTLKSLKIVGAALKNGNINIDIENQGNTAESANVFVGAYDEKDCLIKLKSSDISGLAAGGISKISLEETKNAKYYKIFMWNNLNNGVPISECLTLNV